MNNDPKLYLTALSMMKTVGPKATHKLIEAAGSPENVFNIKRPVSPEFKIPVNVYRELRDSNTLKQAENELKFAEKNNISVISYNDSSYPFRLKQCADAPAVLYKKGDGQIDDKYVIAIVGTRKATHYGRNICEKLIEGLKNLDLSIISGLALGIDGVAHKSALSHNLNTVLF